MPTRRLLIGDVASLTGISPGRIRHYETIGLLAPDHLASRYRVFSPQDVLVLLRIDLLRSLGMGLDDIRACLTEEPDDLRRALEAHRAVLAAEKRRIDHMLLAVDDALAGAEDDANAAMARLARTHRDSLGLFGRLSRPLSGAAADQYTRTFATWDLPVSPLLGQMVLPESVTDFLEALAAAGGHDLLFDRLRLLAGRVAALHPDDGRAADDLAQRWVAEQLGAPPPEPVVRVLDHWIPYLASLPSVTDGVAAMAEGIGPLGGRVLAEIEREAARRGAPVLGVIVVPPAAS